jgi:hypothetical protein
MSLVLISAAGWAQIVDFCQSTIEYSGSMEPLPNCYLACPQGDTDSFEDQGFIIFNITIRDMAGNPIPGIAASDFWVFDCDSQNDIVLCGGQNSCDADGPTDANGTTHMRQSVLSAGGQADGLSVICMGVIIMDPNINCTLPYCFPVLVRSPDINGDLIVNLTDLGLFATGFPPNPYWESSDFNCDGQVGIVDLARFAFHFAPPGHECN